MILKCASRFSSLLSRRGNVARNLIPSTRSLLIHPTTDKLVADRFRELPGTHENAFLTYIWVDGTGENLRAKTMVREAEPKHISDIDTWHFDGSSTYQASGEDSDLILQPVKMYPDPFWPSKSKLILCDVYHPDGTPVATNHRFQAIDAVKKTQAAEPWFGFEQEYTLLGTDKRPLGFPPEGYPAPQGPYYCSAGAGNVVGRDVAEAHLFASRYAGLAVGGNNAEVLLGQWEFQIGPCEGLDAGDQLWMSRYILMRVAEEFGIGVTFDPKPIAGDWNGTGNHCNFSTKDMRNPGGLKNIWAGIEKLRLKHMEHIAVYDPSGGAANRRRLTGLHETADIDRFSAGAGSRTVSVRIPRICEKNGYGWMEDRRPAANCDPYAVINRMLRTVCLDE